MRSTRPDRGSLAGARFLLAASVAIVPLLLVGGAASAQQGPPAGQGSPCAPGGPSSQYPPRECGLSLGKSQLRAGDSVTVAGSGFAPAVALEIRSAPMSLGSAQANGAGDFAATVVIPASLAPGVHTIAAMGTNLVGGAARETTATITVLGAPATRGTDLPRTGSSSNLAAGIGGVMLVGVGSLAVVGARRRRTTT